MNKSNCMFMKSDGKCPNKLQHIIHVSFLSISIRCSFIVQACLEHIVCWRVDDAHMHIKEHVVSTFYPFFILKTLPLMYNILSMNELQCTLDSSGVIGNRKQTLSCSFLNFVVTCPLSMLLCLHFTVESFGAGY
jgi:hypothetical protein